MHLTLIGGGWDAPAQARCVSPFIDASARRATGPPRIGFIWVDEGDGTHWGSRWAALLRASGEVEPVDLPVPIGAAFDPARLEAVDGLFVCGGLTPAYADALAPAADAIRRRVIEDGLPYAGSSAGAAVASTRAVVGGYLDAGRVVCPADAAEDLEEVRVVDGLGLLPEMVDVHVSAWGTLPRLAAAMRCSPSVTAGLGLDEDTAWQVDDDGARVLGRNAVHVLTRDEQRLRWEVRRPATGR